MVPLVLMDSGMECCDGTDTMQKEGSSIEQLRKERDEARAERDAFKKQVDKLNYRILHLKQHVPVPSPADYE